MKIVVIGAGPVGCLAGIYAAQRGHDVEVYELRPGTLPQPIAIPNLLTDHTLPDMRSPDNSKPAEAKSINLALSERGINAMRHAHRPDLLESVLRDTIPMHSRMVHRRSKAGALTASAQAYDVHHRAILAADRGGLNATLLDQLQKMPNAKVFFERKIAAADFRAKTAKLQNRSVSPPQETEIAYDLLIGADGAHSATRSSLMKHTQMDFSQEYIDSFWCQFEIPAKHTTSGPQFLIEPNYLHVWPAGDCLFIAIPSADKTFTCTLFLSRAIFAELESDPQALLLPFFAEKFPGVWPDLITPDQLLAQFSKNPHLPLISIRCSPYHFSSAAVILGDAAHAMVPFYGQGMNAGLEDVRILFEQHLDVHPGPEGLSEALSTYSAERRPDALAISQLAMQNYVEMRADVTSRLYLARKWVEERLSLWFPSLGWSTQYAGVSFENEPYSRVKARAGYQKRVLEGLLGSLGVVGGFGVVTALWRVRHLLRVRVR